MSHKKKHEQHKPNANIMSILSEITVFTHQRVAHNQKRSMVIMNDFYGLLPFL